MNNDFRSVSDKQLEKVSGGNDMVISEKASPERQITVEYKCPNCGKIWSDTYTGCYMTKKGYPAVQCPECEKCWWGGEELKTENQN